MVLEAGGTVDEYFVDVLREEDVRTQEDENDDGDGMTVEDRIIRSSLAMIGKGGKKKKGDQQTELTLTMSVTALRTCAHIHARILAHKTHSHILIPATQLCMVRRVP